LHPTSAQTTSTAPSSTAANHSYSVESGGEVKMTKQEIIEMIERAGFEAVERDTVYNRVVKVAV
jgi:2-iminoacetate synthase ThiH